MVHVPMNDGKFLHISKTVVPMTFLVGVSLGYVMPWSGGPDALWWRAATVVLVALVVSGIAVVPWLFLSRNDADWLGVVIFWPMAAIGLTLVYWMPVSLPLVFLKAGIPYDVDLGSAFLGVWWVVALASGVSPWWRSADRFSEWVMPLEGYSSGPTVILAPFSLMMPWIPLAARLLRGARLRLVRLFAPFRKGCLGLAMTILFGIALLSFTATAFFVVFETPFPIALPAILFVIAAVVHGLAAYVPPDEEGTLRQRASPGWIVLVAVVAIGWAVLRTDWGGARAWLMWTVSGVAFLPLVVVCRFFPPTVPRIAFLLAMLELPIAYHLVSVDVKDRLRIERAGGRVLEIARDLAPDEAARVWPKAFDELVSLGRPTDAAEVAVHWVPILLREGDVERADTVTRQGLAFLGDVPFDRDLPDASLARRRTLMADLLVERTGILLARGDLDGAERVALEAWKKAVQAALWPQVSRLALQMAQGYRSSGQNMEAYWWLRDAENRIRRASGPLEEVERLDAAILDLRRAIGDEAFRAAVEECARKDPQWCGDESR